MSLRGRVPAVQFHGSRSGGYGLYPNLEEIEGLRSKTIRSPSTQHTVAKVIARSVAPLRAATFNAAQVFLTPPQPPESSRAPATAAATRLLTPRLRNSAAT